MNKRINQNEYIEKVSTIHNFKYNYEKTQYLKSKDFIVVSCPIHGDFNIRAVEHYKYGCVKCGRVSTSTKLSKSNTTFINELNKIYNYDIPYRILSEYKNSSKTILIEQDNLLFEMMPDNMLKGRLPSIYNVVDKTSFCINEFKKLHGDYYDYSNTLYVKPKEKITVTCRKHGDFKIYKYQHSSGVGCKKCSDDKNSINMSENPTGWSYSNWVSAGLESENFDSFKVYIIRCWNDEEEFYKIGKTFTTVKNRFKKKNTLPYRYEISLEIISDGYRIVKIEERLKKLYKDIKYIPNIHFNGKYECFTTELPIQEIITYLESS
jgi:hypothetical protein